MGSVHGFTYSMFFILVFWAKTLAIPYVDKDLWQNVCNLASSDQVTIKGFLTTVLVIFKIVYFYTKFKQEVLMLTLGIYLTLVKEVTS